VQSVEVDGKRIRVLAYGLMSGDSGGGPVFYKVGRRLVRYLRSSLEAFLEEGARTNTAGGVPA
jgi:hypothetical protein